MSVQTYQTKKGRTEKLYMNPRGKVVRTYFDKNDQERTKAHKGLATLGGFLGYTGTSYVTPVPKGRMGALLNLGLVGGGTTLGVMGANRLTRRKVDDRARQRFVNTKQTAWGKAK